MKVAIRLDRTPTGFRASCPALPGCVEYGESRQEAIDRIARAVRGYFASMDSQQPVTLATDQNEYSSTQISG